MSTTYLGGVVVTFAYISVFTFSLGGGGCGLQRDNSTKEADPSGRIFRRGAVYRGIYLPSLSGKLQDERLEFAYLRYAHRQRQKSLMLVNSADIILKILVALRVFCVLPGDSDPDPALRGS